MAHVINEFEELKLIPHEIETKKFLLVAVVLTVIFSVIVLSYNPTPEMLLFKIGIFSTIITIIWILYERYLWRFPFFRMMGWLCSTPDLNGRWEGTVDRHGENNPHKFILEITQTMTKLQCYTYSQNSNGESLVVKILKDGVSKKYRLLSYWSCKTKSKTEKSKFCTFQGVSLIEINFEGGQKILKDYYFTNRDPATRGDVELQWVSKELTGGFLKGE